LTDSDAVYTGSRQEIKRWAKENMFEVSYLKGDDNEFAINAFMAIRKPV
jgi:hypothetical protein